MTAEYDWADYESGPFCRHWSEPWDCDLKCATCGHACGHHAFGDGVQSACRPGDAECSCREWTEAA